MSKVNVGDKVYLPNEKQGYTVKARSDRFIICSKPFNLKHTCIYFIVDLEKRVRGTDNLIWGHGYNTQEDYDDALKMLENGEMQVSHRNVVDLDIDIC